MRSPEEIESRISVLLRTRDNINSLEEEGKLSPETAEEYRTVCDSTLNLLEWAKGNDVDAFTSSPVLDKVVLIAQDQEVFESLDLEELPEVAWTEPKKKESKKKVVKEV